VPNLVALVTGAVSRALSLRQKASVPGGGFLLPISGGYLPPDSPWNYFQTGYPAAGFSYGSRSAVVAACVSAYAQTVAMCPGTHWQTQANSGRKRVTTSALSRVLRQPNSYQSSSDFFLNLTHGLYSDGNAYALALRNARFEVDSLHLMNPRMSMPVVAPDGSIFYSLGGNWVVDQMVPREMLSRVPARNVLHVKLESRPENPLIGESPLTSVITDIAAGETIIRAGAAYAANEGRPSGIITTDQNLTDEQIKQIHALWDQFTKGINAGGTPILSQGFKWQEGVKGVGSRDAQMAEMLQISDQRIATAYRVPLAMLSLIAGQAPQASTTELIQHWLATGLGFALEHIEQAVTNFFGLLGWPDEYLELDTRALERMQFKDRIEALARGVQGGIYAPNEARAMEDLPAAEDGDEPRVQQQVVPLSFASQPPPPPAAPPAPAPNDNQPPKTDEANAAGFAASIRRAADRHFRA
jgi:HK97 family phage portal protein